MTLLDASLLPSALSAGQLLAPPTPERFVELGTAGKDPAAPCLVFVNFDDSYSLANGNDPIGQRYQEARKALTVIADAARTDMQQVSIFRFDHPTVPAVLLQPLHTKEGRKAILQAVAPSKNSIGSSALAASMMAINRLAEQHENADRIAVIFSDFELLDQNPAQPYEEMAAFPGVVHAIVMNASPPPRLLALPNVLITQVSSSDPPGILAAALLHSLTRLRPGATRPRVRTVLRSTR